MMRKTVASSLNERQKPLRLLDLKRKRGWRMKSMKGCWQRYREWPKKYALRRRKNSRKS